jgi:hypothetical protein
MSEPRSQWESRPGPAESGGDRPWYRRPILLAVLAVIAAIAIGAVISWAGNGMVGNGTVVPPPETPEGVIAGQTGEPGTEPAVIELGEPATVEGLTMVVLSFQHSDEVTLENPPEGGRVFVAYEVMFRAETEDQDIGPATFVVETPRGEVAEIRSVAHEGWTPQLQNDVVPAGSEVTRWLVFDVAEPGGIVSLSYRPEGVGADPGFVFEHLCCE